MRILEDELKLFVPIKIAFKWFENLDENYLRWHPKAHHEFVWLSGKPIRKGSRFYFIESIKGHKHKMLMEVSEYVENSKLSFFRLKFRLYQKYFLNNSCPF